MNSPIKYVNDRCSDIGKDFLLVLKFSLYTTPSTDVCESSEVFVVVRPLKRCLPTACVESTEGESEGSGFIVEVEKPWWPAHKQASQTGKQAACLAGMAGREGGREGDRQLGPEGTLIVRRTHSKQSSASSEIKQIFTSIFCPIFFCQPTLLLSCTQQYYSWRGSLYIVYFTQSFKCHLNSVRIIFVVFLHRQNVLQKNSTQNVQFSHKMYNIPKNVQFSHQNLPFFQPNVRFFSWIWIFPQDWIFSIDAIICNRAFSEFLLFIGLFALIRARDGILLFNSIIMP